MVPPAPLATDAGQRVYSPLVLRAYDAVVLDLSCRWIWRCPSDAIQALYDRHASAVHLDVGVGTGRFLDRCRFPVSRPEITLLDLNAHSLDHCARRIARYAPTRLHADVLRPIPVPATRFASIGASFLFHCLPADAAGGKWRALDHLARLLRDDGVLFGATALGSGIALNPAQRILMGVYNRRGIFGNDQDSPAALEAALSARFHDVAIERRGVIALFRVRGRRDA